jgi:hypothetical protein
MWRWLVSRLDDRALPRRRRAKARSHVVPLYCSLFRASRRVLLASTCPHIEHNTPSTTLAYRGSSPPIKEVGIRFGLKAKDTRRQQECSFGFREVNSRKHSAPQRIPLRLPREPRAADRARLPSFPHERQRVPKPVHLWKTPGRTNLPEGMTRRGTPGPPPRSRTLAVSLRLSPKGWRAAPSRGYRTRLSDSAEAACALPKATPHARAILCCYLTQSSLLSSSW